MRIFHFGLACLAVAACSQTDLNGPRSMSGKNAKYPIRVTREMAQLPPSPTGPAAPDVRAAEERVAALRQRVLDHARPEDRAGIAQSFDTPHHIIFGTNDPVLSDLLSQYYAARIHVNVERFRARSVAAATEPLPVHLAFGDEPGAGATVFRRRLMAQSTVVVLGRDATPATLAAALHALDRSRQTDGDQLQMDQRLVVEAPQGQLPPQETARLAAELAAARQAPPRAIEGIGTLPSITIASNKLTK